MVAAGEEVASGSAARSYEVGLVKQLPWISRIGDDCEISDSVGEIVSLRRRADFTEETSRLFMMPAVVRAVVRGLELADATADAATSKGYDNLMVLELTHRVEQRVHTLAGLNAEAEVYLDTAVGPHPASYNEGSIDAWRLTELLRDSIGGIIDELIDDRGGSNAIAKLTYFADRRLEVIAHGLERPPSQIEKFRRERGILPHGELDAAAASVLSYLVGVAFGRWDFRCAGGLEPALGDLFDPVLVHPPGMLLDEGRPARTTPVGYELDLPPEQLLLDQPGHTWDIVGRVTASASLLVEDADRLLDDLMSHLDGRDLRHQLRRYFFKEHLTRYSKSRRKAPIYWPLYTPSRAWGVWVYVPSLRRETLYAIEAAASARLQAAQSEISRLMRVVSEGVADPSTRQAATALEFEQRLFEELTVFQREAERVAALGWEPDLDDGIVLCAAPLADLFGAWPEAAKQRKHIRDGKYPWASVSQWSDEL